MKVRFEGARERVKLSENALIGLVNHYIQTTRKLDGSPAINKIVRKLGWSNDQWAKFKAQAGKLLIWDHIPDFSVLASDATGSPEADKKSLVDRGIQPTDVSRKITNAFGSLKNDLMSLGLTQEEVEGALAMQNFGENRFANAMETISSGVFKTAVKLQTQQRIVEQRLELVRSQIAEYGTMMSDERKEWVSEEWALTRQYQAIGKLLAEIQDTWYQGSAQLALVRMRMREDGGAPNGRQSREPTRPAFRPRVVINAEEVKPQKNGSEYKPEKDAILNEPE